MIKNIQFKNIKNDFQTKLKNDISDIQICQKVLVPADKSRNIYKMETADYKKLLHDNITRTYKKSDQRKIDNINKDAKKIALVLDLEHRIEKIVVYNRATQDIFSESQGNKILTFPYTLF